MFDEHMIEITQSEYTELLRYKEEYEKLKAKYDNLLDASIERSREYSRRLSEILQVLPALTKVN